MHNSSRKEARAEGESTDIKIKFRKEDLPMLIGIGLMIFAFFYSQFSTASILVLTTAATQVSQLSEAQTLTIKHPHHKWWGFSTSSNS
jgi:hypothetical protein